jgi:hypothetical protein
MCPHKMTAGHTPRSPFQLDIVQTIQAGIIKENNGSCRPAMADSCISGSPVTFASVMIGVPSAPNATGAVFAISVSPAA